MLGNNLMVAFSRLSLQSVLYHQHSPFALDVVVKTWLICCLSFSDRKGCSFYSSCNVLHNSNTPSIPSSVKSSLTSLNLVSTSSHILYFNTAMGYGNYTRGHTKTMYSTSVSGCEGICINGGCHFSISVKF